MTNELAEKIPPQNNEAEQSALGACMIDAEALQKVLLIITDPMQFYRNPHQEIYQAIQSLHYKGQPVDIITLSEELKSKKKLEEAGGAAYLTYLIDACPSTANAEYYSEIVREKAQLRALQQALHIANNDILRGREREEITGTLTKALLEQCGNSRPTCVTAADLASRFYQVITENYPNGINTMEMVKTGLPEFDDMFGGLYKSILHIIAARPGMGKSALMEDIALNIALRGEPVAVFSFEIPDMMLFSRIMAKEARINNDVLMHGPTDSHIERIKNSCARLSNYPLYFFFQPMSTARIKAECLAIQQRHGSLGAVFIDRFQLIPEPWKGEKDHNYYEELSHRIDFMARELRAPVILLTQLNRECEKRQDKRPVLSDLRDTGALEQDGKMVIFIYRDEYYNPLSTDKGRADIAIAKNSFGKQGFLKLAFLKELPSFRSLEGHYSDNPF